MWNLGKEHRLLGKPNLGSNPGAATYETCDEAPLSRLWDVAEDGCYCTGRLLPKQKDAGEGSAEAKCAGRARMRSNRAPRRRLGGLGPAPGADGCLQLAEEPVASWHV